ncbi:MAG TPA: hypothetical protein VM901_05225 [Bdellovibrionota bacterium]|jgi:hypothetical protein|nr:hypothetical protein [Bdellovibrionota bacterium]
MGRFTYIFALLLLTACGQSLESMMFYEAARRQYALDNQMLQLFVRGPTWDGSDPAATAKSNIQSIPKTFITLPGLASLEGPLRGYYTNGFGYGVQVQYTETSTQSPIFNTWAGAQLNWNSKEFKAFMLYAHMAKAHKVAFVDEPLNLSSIHALVTDDNYVVKGTAATGGNALLDTHFSYDNGGLFVNFYQHTAQSALTKLNMVDEADAIYHEYAHYLQYVYNETAMRVPITHTEEGSVTNPDLDAIIEGTADYYAAAMTKSERILVYLENNMPLVRADTVVREGFHNRSLSRLWRFPDTYIFNPHMDGRVIAGAINDIRKYIMNQKVQISGCSDSLNPNPACFVKFGVDIVGIEDPWIKAFEISMLAFQNLTTPATNSYRFYARKLIDQVETFAASQGCAVSPAACGAEVRADMLQLLAGRGLINLDTNYTYLTLDPANATHVGTAATARIRVNSSFNFVPFDPNRNLSNADNKLSECEIAVVMPDILNNTNVVGDATDFYNVHFRIKPNTISNLVPVRDANDQIIEQIEGSSIEWKFWGSLAPGRRGVDNVAVSASDWYKSVNGSHFAKPPTLTNFPVPFGYMVSIPRNRAGQVINITWEVRMTPKTSNALQRVAFQLTQQLTIDEDLTFCD